ncbi:sugar kinase [Nocardiopsis changdeensis]|uniref:Sugar kinase n=1 Tax=Nocardiopsis changdeensis TaxID=2831969 RepID=A0ABX8BNB4_9ACTN|nr:MULTISPECIES: sugar kinase [Nocardiopsis]QUX23200.1 sugar kinase [Nocardiopsis changdeensis]QYX39143.1 sugar kinase [Nocardiopsis sp. MT53]
MSTPTRPDAVCVGETMAVLHSAEPLAAGASLTLGTGGAESNVAVALARLGHTAAWVSRVGDDPFGRIVTDAVAERGVDVSGVTVDPGRPTGLYVKDTAPGGAGVLYYRSSSAASALSAVDADRVWSFGARLVHLSGITPALSAQAAALVEHLLTGHSDAGALRSFDVNHRPALWPARAAAHILLDLARRADVVFVGRDEAERLWGTPTAEDVRAVLPEVPTLVVKDAEHGATCFSGADAVFEPSPEVDVVEAVGAGDAFAAGFLSGLLDGLPVRSRLRLGHAVAGEVLRSRGDTLEDPPRSVAEIREGGPVSR